MKKKILAYSLLAVAITINVFTTTSRNIIQSLDSIVVEALANSEIDDPGMGGAYLKCYCALMSDNSCAVNNNGSSVCAGGYNVKCWDYDRNCN